MGCNAPSVPKVVPGVLPPAYRRGHTVSRGFGEPQSYLLSVCWDGRGVGRAARRLRCVSGSMEAASVHVAFVLGADCRKCDRMDTPEAAPTRMSLVGQKHACRLLGQDGETNSVTRRNRCRRQPRSDRRKGQVLLRDFLQRSGDRRLAMLQSFEQTAAVGCCNGSAVQPPKLQLADVTHRGSRRKTAT